jgi:hypothetical protein
MSADYDVGVLALQSPPPASVITPYRPAVTVRNNGVHDALASGTLRIYSAGRLIFTTELYSATIPPGETRQALGVDYWTPPAEGQYVIFGYVTCPLDQVEPNNNLAPVTINVSGLPPPPPTPVTPHAGQHEEGGADEVILDGLHGRLADAQTPLDHRAEHQAGGGDELSVEGLRGILHDGQPIADHHESHEDGGGDELNVDNLHGELYNKQKPKTHDNAAHDPNYATSPHGNSAHDPDFVSVAVLQAHEAKTKVHGTDPHNVLGDDHLTESPAHANASNLEQTANKGEVNGYAPLDASKYVPVANLGAPDLQPPVPDPRVLHYDHCFREPIAAPQSHHLSHESLGGDKVSIAGLSGKAADPQDPVGHHLTHEIGGSDEITGLGAAPHKATHENGGTDEMSVAGLSGALADAQPTGTAYSTSANDTLPGDTPDTAIASVSIPPALLHSHCHIEARIFSRVGSPTPTPGQYFTLTLKVDGAPIQAVDVPVEAVTDSSALTSIWLFSNSSSNWIDHMQVTGSGSSPFVVNAFGLSAHTRPVGSTVISISITGHADHDTLIALFSSVIFTRSGID